MAMGRPKERVIPSTICLKKTSAEEKPGRKNMNITPRIALTMGKRLRKGMVKLNICLKSMPYFSLNQYAGSPVAILVY